MTRIKLCVFLKFSTLPSSAFQKSKGGNLKSQKLKDTENEKNINTKIIVL